MLEAIGDALLMVAARLYLSHRTRTPYELYTRLTSRMICNSTLAQIAEAEGIGTGEGKARANALEIEAACVFYAEGFAGVRAWAFNLFERYFDITGEVRRILNPPPAETLFNAIRSALRMVISLHNGKVTGRNLDNLTKQIVGQFRANGTGASH